MCFFFFTGQLRGSTPYDRSLHSTNPFDEPSNEDAHSTNPFDESSNPFADPANPSTNPFDEQPNDESSKNPFDDPTEAFVYKDLNSSRGGASRSNLTLKSSGINRAPAKSNRSATLPGKLRTGVGNGQSGKTEALAPRKPLGSVAERPHYHGTPPSTPPEEKQRARPITPPVIEPDVG